MDPSLMLTWTAGGKRRAEEVTGERVIIGRAPICDIVIKEERVSRQHLTIVREDGGFAAVDMGSANGTYVNGKPIVRRALRNGDRITLGDVTLTVMFDDEVSSVSHRVVISDAPEQRNMTVLPMSEMDSVMGLSVSSVRRDTRSDAIPLFSQVAEAILTAEELDPMLERIMDVIFECLPASRALIGLCEKGLEDLEPRVTRSVRPADDGTISISRSIASTAVASKQAVLVGDTSQDDRFAGEKSILEMNIRSALCAPLYHDGRVSGLIYVDSLSLAQPFLQDHLQVLSTLAVMTAVGVDHVRLIGQIRREQHIRAHIERYASPAVLERIISSSTSGGAKMFTEEREVTVLFGDICGFTTLAEKHGPIETTEMLNEVFSRLVEFVFEEEGTLDKFLGDGIMSFFGAPLPQEDHAVRAVRAALRMQSEIVSLGRLLSTSEPIRMRIGINTGTVVAGDVGSPQRKDYTVIGDAVNIASRLESSVARPGDVVIGPDTRELIGDAFECHPLGEVLLKGKGKSIQPWRVVRELDG